MALQTVVPGLFIVPLGMVNAYLLEDGHRLVIIDTGVPGSGDTILAAVAETGRQPEDVSLILVTHLHADHSGGLARLKAATGAPAAMHPLDAELVRQGRTKRPSRAAPGLANWLIFHLFVQRQSGRDGIAPVPIERELHDGETLDVAGGLQVIHAPGHAAGQVTFLWPQHGGVLLVADAASHMVGLGYPILFEDEPLGRQSLRKLAGLDFEVACFGHGRPLTQGAAAEFGHKWG